MKLGFNPANNKLAMRAKLTEGCCCCWREAYLCVGESPTGLWIRCEDIQDTVLRMGTACVYFPGPDAATPGPGRVDAGTWWPSCAACVAACPPCSSGGLPTEVDVETAGGPWQCTGELGTPGTIPMTPTAVLNEMFEGSAFPMGAALYCGFPEWLTPGEPGYAEALALTTPGGMPWVLVVDEGTSVAACGEYVHIFVLDCSAAVTGTYLHAYSYSFPGYPTFTNSGSVVVS